MDIHNITAVLVDWLIETEQIIFIIHEFEWTEIINIGNKLGHNLTSRCNVEPTWRVFSDVHLARVLRIHVRYSRVLDIADYHRIAVRIQESPAFRVTTKHQWSTTRRPRQSRESVFWGHRNTISHQCTQLFLNINQIFAR